MSNRKQRKQERRRKKHRRKLLKRALRIAALLWSETQSLHFPSAVTDVQRCLGEPFNDAVADKSFRG
jgi:hypothetical protein